MSDTLSTAASSAYNTASSVISQYITLADRMPITTTRIDYEKFINNHVSNMENKSSVTVSLGGYMNIDANGIMASAYPVPKLIKQRGDKVIVTWMDDTYTVVIREKDTPDNLYLAFCAAFAKKMFGTTGKVIKAFDKADEREIKRREEARLAEEAAKKAEEEKLLEEKKRAEFEDSVKNRMRQISIELEAMRRLEREEAAKRDAERAAEE